MKTLLFLFWIPLFLLADIHSPYEDKVQNFATQHARILSSKSANLKFTFQLEKDASFMWRGSYVIDSASLKGEMYFYEYQDSLACSRAFDLLLAHFPTEGVRLRKGVNMRGFKITPSVFIITKTQISVLNAPCETDTARFNSLKAEFITTFRDSGATLIDCGCGGPVIWK